MKQDNNQEMFPIVDEQGNIISDATRGECHNGSKVLCGWWKLVTIFFTILYS